MTVAVPGGRLDVLFGVPFALSWPQDAAASLAVSGLDVDFNSAVLHENRVRAQDNYIALDLTGGAEWVSDISAYRVAMIDSLEVNRDDGDFDFDSALQPEMVAADVVRQSATRVTIKIDKVAVPFNVTALGQFITPSETTFPLAAIAGASSVSVSGGVNIYQAESLNLGTGNQCATVTTEIDLLLTDNFLGPKFTVPDDSTWCTVGGTAFKLKTEVDAIGVSLLLDGSGDHTAPGSGGRDIVALAGGGGSGTFVYYHETASDLYITRYINDWDATQYLCNWRAYMPKADWAGSFDEAGTVLWFADV